VSASERFFGEASVLFDRLDPRRPVRLVGVSGSGLCHEEDGAQLALYSGDEILRRYRREGVRPASLVEGVRTKVSPRC